MSDDPRVIFVGPGAEAFNYFSDRFDALFDQLDDMEARLMALSQAEQMALDGLKAKIDAFGNGSIAVQQALTAEIARLQALLDTAQANDTTDAAMIDQLKASITNLEAAAATHEADVVSAFADASDDFDKFATP